MKKYHWFNNVEFENKKENNFNESDIFKAKKAVAQFFEGKRLKAYKDTVGKWTIGIGKNFSDVPFSKEEEELIRKRLGDYTSHINSLVLKHGITEEECDLLFYNSYKIAEKDAKDLVDIFDELNIYRQIALVDFSFNVGKTTMESFKNTLGAINRKDFKRAGSGFRNSLWYRQVGRRGDIISSVIEEGRFSNDFIDIVKLETGFDIRSLKIF